MNNLTKSLKQIRNYTLANDELRKSHHFLFNAPFKNSQGKADIIMMGLNPGETSDDWFYEGETPTENSNEFDFHHYSKNSPSSKRWESITNYFLGDISENIFLSEFFFWSSPQVGEKKGKEKFSERFGYKFIDCPHLDYCRERNKELIRFHKPKLILATGVSYAELFIKLYNMSVIKILKGKRMRIIIHADFMNTPFLFIPHPSSAHISKSEKKEILNYLLNL